MLFHSAEDPRLAEMAFRVVQNSAPMSVTATTAQIAIGMPLVLDISTGSLPSSDVTANQNYVTKPNATASVAANNLFCGVLVRVPGRKSYLGPEETGLAQVYGPVLNALVRRDVAGLPGGSLLQLSDIGFTLPSTAGPPMGQAGLAVLMDALAVSTATEMATARVFLRCM
jgi:hypothetical protein